MMRVGDIVGESQKGSVSQFLLSRPYGIPADNRMLFHLFKFRFGEFPWFQQNAVRTPTLPMSCKGADL